MQPNNICSNTLPESLNLKFSDHTSIAHEAAPFSAVCASPMVTLGENLLQRGLKNIGKSAETNSSVFLDVCLPVRI